jgi:membrane protein DedA with SNARE-associated domain
MANLVHVLLHFFYTHELVTLFFALLIEEAGVPIPVPGDTLLMLAGAEPHKTVWSGIAVVAVSSLAVFLGSSALYSVMHHGGRPLLLKYGKYLHINERSLGRVEGWFHRHGRKAVVVGRLVPGLRLPTTVAAGISGLTPTEWFITAAIAAPIWSAFFYLLGALLGREGPFIIAFLSDILEDIPKGLLTVSALLVIFIGLAGGAIRLARQRNQERLRRHRAKLYGHDPNGEADASDMASQ